MQPLRTAEISTNRPKSARQNSPGAALAAAPRTVAALFVNRHGPYKNVAGIEVWDKRKDARQYPGPHRVIAHPPCERWGRFAHGSPQAPGRFTPGDDAGCFLAALLAVKKWGGIIEHPADSAAWFVHGLLPPVPGAGWTIADFEGGWTAQVWQGTYGHPAPKKTWLYANGIQLHSLDWSEPIGYSVPVERLSANKRARTPERFRDALLAMVRAD